MALPLKTNFCKLKKEVTVKDRVIRDVMNLLEHEKGDY